MTLLVSELVAIFSQFVWPLIRISAVLLTGPFFSLAAVSYRIRIAVVLVLTYGAPKTVLTVAERHGQSKDFLMGVEHRRPGA